MADQPLYVELGERRYPIYVVAEGLEGLGMAMSEHVPVGRCVVVTNPVVGALYADDALASLRQAGFAPELLQVPDGESHKHLDTYVGLLTELLTLGIDRKTPIVALGGGVTGDIVGFAAATALRGVPLVQVPTTLLAMVDSSVGGKTGVNTSHGKNLVGAFYQPKMVYAAMEVLETLDDAEWRCGLGEALKHGVIRDEMLFEWMVENADGLNRREPDIVGEVVRRCCTIKAEVVVADELEAGVRAILNFGHTVGHALETAAGHGSIRHGEAVAIGMLAESRFAVDQDLGTDPGMPKVLYAGLQALGLRAAAPSATEEDMLAAARRDKKVAGDALNFVVPIRIGEVRLCKLPVTALPELLSYARPPMEEL
jgi:3-dehydroquinate synthase